uniref:Phospholipid transfer protein n=1 Tax=Molossus molossus TaxID=27622 RepID=A0A7J8HJE6_MOLMO|nr:phospholipid transfer protein [Molossus molossus]
MALFGALFLALLAGAHAEIPGCKIRITSQALELVKQEGLRFLEQELETVTIPNLGGREGHFYYNISEKVYEFLSTLIISGMRFLLNQQICPVLYHAGMVLLNSFLATVPVRSSVDNLVGIDYSLLKDPVVSTSSLDMDFRGAFFPLAQGNWSLPNRAVEPQLQEEERMVYVAFSEFFFDSAMESYFQAGALQLSLVGDKVPKDLDMLLRASFFGSIVLLTPAMIDSPLKLELRVMAPPRCTIKPSGTTISVTASVTIAVVPPNKPEVQLSSIIMDARLSAKMALREKALRVHLDLRKFRIYSNQSALESLALIPLQAPLKTMLQLGVMPLINERTRRGVQIPLPEGMDFLREVVTNHAGFLTIGADLHFVKGLREMIEKRPEKNRPADPVASQAASAPPPSTAAA